MCRFQFLAVTFLLLAGALPAGKQKGAFFPLTEVEVVMDANVMEIGPDAKPIWVGLRIVRPEKHNNALLMVRFTSCADSEYRLLQANEGRRFRITSEKG